MLESLSDQLRQVETHDDLDRAILSLSQALDVAHVVYHSVNSSGAEYAVTTYRSEWVDQYLGNDYARIDPVVQACLRRFTPVDWKQLNWSGKANQRFMHEAIDAGVGNQGFSVPIRGPSGQFALFTVSSSEDDETWGKFTKDNARALILASHFINQKALEIDLGSDQAEVVNLSPRETDALTMLAMGFSRAQAADHLSISEHTLRVYIESARHKLTAANTTHAVARAMNQGLLSI